VSGSAVSTLGAFRTGAAGTVVVWSVWRGAARPGGCGGWLGAGGSARLWSVTVTVSRSNMALSSQSAAMRARRSQVGIGEVVGAVQDPGGPAGQWVAVDVGDAAVSAEGGHRAAVGVGVVAQPGPGEVGEDVVGEDFGLADRVLGGGGGGRAGVGAGQVGYGGGVAGGEHVGVPGDLQGGAGVHPAGRVDGGRWRRVGGGGRLRRSRSRCRS